MSTVRDSDNNAFHLLRISAAAAVVFSHQFPITDTQPPSWLHSNMVGGVAVMTFFTISGYLVTLSWLHDPRLMAFIGKRLLRLWPGMFVAVCAGIFLFGPIFTALPTHEFFLHSLTFDHWRNLLLVKAYPNLPGVFPENPLAGLMNGPLWTIPLEVMCYAVLAGAGALGILRSRWLASAVLAGYIVFFLTLRNADLTGVMRHWFEYPAYFACGSLIALNRKWFVYHARAFLLGALLLAVFLFFGLGLEHSAGLVLLPPLLIFLGLQTGTVLSRVHRLGDPSYGIYLLGCPIQQAVQATWPQLPFLAGLVLALTIALVAGYASWHAIESPALRLKRFLNSHHN